MFRRYSKYNAKKVEIDGIKFDSKAEGEYYLHLKQQVAEGKILGFERQIKITLQESFYLEIEGVKKKIRAITYVADFKVIKNDGSITYIDVKGIETTEFRMKRKMFMNLYQIPLVTVKKQKGDWLYSYV